MFWVRDLSKSRNQSISQWYQHSVRFVKTNFGVVIASESNNSVFQLIHKNHFTFVFYAYFFNFYCVSQEYDILYLETRRSETLENEVFEVKSPPQAPKKSVFFRSNFEIFGVFISL